MVASSSDTNLTLRDNLAINDVTSEAFTILGENGVLRSANYHECPECTHTYKATGDVIPQAGDDPAGVVGIDEHRNVPELTGDDADLGLQYAAMARRQAAIQRAAGRPEDTDMEEESVRMVVVDGIVMGHQVRKISSNCDDNC
jgi:hypothetical protein